MTDRNLHSCQRKLRLLHESLSSKNEVKTVLALLDEIARLRAQIATLNADLASGLSEGASRHEDFGADPMSAPD